MRGDAGKPLSPTVTRENEMYGTTEQVIREHYEDLRRELAADAGRRGVETFVGSVLPDNRPMLGLIGAMFAGSKRAFDDGALLVRMPLQALDPADLGRAA